MSYTPTKKRTYEAMYKHTRKHGIKRALVKMALEEEAWTILSALSHVTEDHMAKCVAQALANHR